MNTNLNITLALLAIGIEIPAPSEDVKVRTAENKRQLLEMARNGKPRPDYNSKLGVALRCYTSRKSNSYDEVFDKHIRLTAQLWYKITVTEKKQQLLEMARAGKPRPSCKKGKLGMALCHYTNKKSNSYDEDFDKEIRRTAPHWFRASSQISKDKAV